MSAAVVSVVAVFVVPVTVAGMAAGTTVVSTSTLPVLVSHGLESWVAAGSATPTAELQLAAKYWWVFHTVKAIAATASLVVLTPLLGWVWAKYHSQAAPHRRAPLAIAIPTVAASAALMLLVSIANIQGSVAPLTSVLGFLPRDHTTPAMAVLRDQLASGVVTPASATLLSDFRLYHAALAACAAVILVGLVATARLTWSRRAKHPRISKHSFLAIGLALTVSVMFMGLVLLANLSTTLDPLPALKAFLAGGL